MQQASFDHYAAGYDYHFTFSPIGLLQRKQVYKQLLPVIDKNKTLLELNCGTGHDAIALLDHVKSILATDASASMISVCEQKIKTKTTRLVFKTISIQQIENEIASAGFIFSNFGGLNCLSPLELKTFANKCSNLASEHTDLCFVVMGRKCFWERLYFISKFKFSKAFRRQQKTGLKTQIDTSELITWYYSPKDIKQLFGSAFEVRTYSPIGLFVPPSYLNAFFENKKKLLDLCATMDNVFGNFKWLANYGDHFYIHLKKTH